MTGDLPNDDDANALRLMADRGMDMSRPVRFQFSIHVEDKSAAQIVLDILNSAEIGDVRGFSYDEGELEEGEEMTEENEEYWPSWSVYVYKVMVPSYESVVAFQKILSELCQDTGKPDGWTVEVNP